MGKEGSELSAPALCVPTLALPPFRSSLQVAGENRRNEYPTGGQASQKQMANPHAQPSSTARATESAGHRVEAHLFPLLSTTSEQGCHIVCDLL